LHLPGRANPADLDQGSIFFVGTATTVIRYGGFTILTDPNFLHAGDHVHLGYGITAQRQTNPAIEIEQLPPLDLCVLSHMHGDHWDRVASERLPKALPIVTTKHATLSLKRQGFNNTHALDTWDTITLTKGDTWLRITSMPGKHGPGALNALLPPVMGSILEWGTGSEQPRFRLYISGDTLFGSHLHEIPRRFPDIDLALVHLGGTMVFGIVVTMDAQQGVRAVRVIQPRAVIPIHYNDYDAFKSPVEDFLRAMAEANLPTEVHYLAHGDTYTFDVRQRQGNAIRPMPGYAF
jgi:L-ascorbate metabolism protein UlaG (beta-lactamase superfamily)